MTLFWDSIVENYTYLFDELSHPVTKNWLLMSGPIPIFAILLSYNIFCSKVGPTLMKNRPPYSLRTTIKLYNIFQVIISAYITYEGYVYLFSGKFNFQCQGVPEREERVARGIQLYLITKLVELLDTIFFVLRKSNRQITFLHLYHHTIMPIITWIGLKYFPGGQGVIFGAINSLVHVVMYSYYLISGLGPQYQKYLWWKKYLTIMQIVQFLIILLHSVNSLFYSCSYLPALKVLTIIFSSIFVYMFSKFYYLHYILTRIKNQGVTTDKIQNPDGDRKYEKTAVNNTLCLNGGVNKNSSCDKTEYIQSSNKKLTDCNQTNGKHFTNKNKLL